MSGLTVVIPLQIPTHFEAFWPGRGARRARRRRVAQRITRISTATPIRAPYRTSAGRLSLNRVTRTATTISAPVASWMRRKGRESG